MNYYCGSYLTVLLEYLDLFELQGTANIQEGLGYATGTQQPQKKLQHTITSTAFKNAKK